MKELTILTRPAGDPKWTGDGHYAVTRSLLTGLDRIGYAGYNYQPDDENEVSENVHVLFGIAPCDTLQYAIRLKQEGRIKRLSAGPNVFNFPFEQNFLIESPELDKYLVPSDWFKQMFALMSPPSEDKLFSWPCGVDSELLSHEHITTEKAIIYRKGKKSDDFYGQIEKIVRKHGYEPETFSYGAYKLEDFYNALEKAAFLVAVSDTESQGLYLAEAWAFDVPTICYACDHYTWDKSLYGIEISWPYTSTCPYLTEYTGVRFHNFKELEKYITHMDFIIEDTSPREWVSNNMTDEVCARDFLNILFDIRID